MRKTHNGFSLPKDVSFRKERMESGWAYVFEFENSDLDAKPILWIQNMII